MPITTTCPNPNCALQYSLSESAAGRKTRCRGCRQTFIISDSATVNGTTPPAPAAVSRPSPSHADLQTVGRFVVRGKLGAGAFGTVYRAYDPNLNREVALKIPNPGAMDTPQRVERFLREAKAAAILRHPHIVPVFDAGQDGGNYYIASAFINGKPLSGTIEEHGTDFTRAARIVRELAEALAYAHEQGIVHRDVKPQNIMVDEHDRVHLMDFGLAARHDEEARLTADGAVMGTPAYMSPEQAAGQQGEAKPATDQYAAGVVLYELLTGTVPFKGPLPVVMHNVIHTEPDSPRKSRASVPKDLETICLKAMAKDTEDRYENCQELADDLRRWLEGEPISARRMSLYERAMRWVEKEPKLAIGATVIVVVFVVSFVLISAFARRANTARREMEPTLAQAKQDAATAREAEKRAADAVAEAQAARALEEQSIREKLGALAAATEERKKAEVLQATLEEERKKIKALQAPPP
jgi:tRNA A-37 threonylcarbamoyl transferase component Bud32